MSSWFLDSELSTCSLLLLLLLLSGGEEHLFQMTHRRFDILLIVIA